MDWLTVVASFVGSAIAGPAVVGIMKFLTDRSIERQKAAQSRELLESQNAFSVGATSHMATVAFDKHVGFCEEYVEGVYKVLNTLIQDGATEKWALWLTYEIEVKLDQFERRIAQIIGGAAQDVDADGAPVSNERSVAKSIADLREILHTEELTALRNELVMRSSKEPLQIRPHARHVPGAVRKPKRKD
jgi:hypothetical protein